MALPNPSQATIKKIERMLYGFLWNNKPDPVKRLKLIQKYELDGLKMIDLTSFIHSLKLSWITRLCTSTGIWATVAMLEEMDPFKLLTYGTAQMKTIKSQIKNVFWKDVMESLIQFNQLLILEPNAILREKIWFSDYTKFKTSNVKQWDKKGLRFIGDLFNLDNGNILTREEIKVQYRISMTFLCYESLIRSLPSSIRQARSILFQRPNIPYKLQLFLNKPNITKYYYSLLVDALNKKCNVTDSNLKRKWNRDIGYHEAGSLLHVKKATNSVYLLYLHYRVINRIITTNKYLQDIGISDHSTCTFCTRETETITHLFWRCPVTQTFLQNIDRELYTQYQIHLDYREQSWFFLQETDPLQTLLICITKAIIFKARNVERKPEVSHMMNTLKIEAQKEQFASKLNNKLDTFEKKWKTLQNILQE